MKKIIKLATAGIAISIASGCATITQSEMQELNLTTKDKNGQTVSEAKCALSNDRGNWEATSPGIISIRKSSKDLSVECEKQGQEKGILKAISRASGGMAGNIIFGGGIGAVIDHNTGKGYNYPDEIPVIMGDSVVIDRRVQQNEKRAATKAAE